MSEIEPRIATASKTKEIIRKHAFRLKKSYGQNFLVDGHVLNKIISSANITKEDLVIEIGPGIGGLTQVLAESARQVVAIEIDKNLIPILNDTLKEFDNIDVINQDILKVDLSELIQSYGYVSVKVVANLPYYITTPIIMDLLEKKYPIRSITVMVQKEVAARMSAKPSTKDYGALSLAVQYYAAPYLVANVPQNCFIPRPNVDSAVIQLTVLDKPAVTVGNSDKEKFLFGMIKSAFSMRRKTLINCLFSCEFLDFSKEELKTILVELGFDENVRGETLTLKEFLRIAERLWL